MRTPSAAPAVKLEALDLRGLNYYSNPSIGDFDCPKQRQSLFSLLSDQSEPLREALQEVEASHLVKAHATAVYETYQQLVTLLQDIAADKTDILVKLSEINAWERASKEVFARVPSLKEYDLSTEQNVYALKLIVLSQLLAKDSANTALQQAKLNLHRDLVALYQRLFPKARAGLFEDGGVVFDLTVGLVLQLMESRTNETQKFAAIQRYVDNVPHLPSTYLRRGLITLLITAIVFVTLLMAQAHFAGIPPLAAFLMINLLNSGLPQILAISNLAAPAVACALSVLLPYLLSNQSGKIQHIKKTARLFVESQQAALSTMEATVANPMHGVGAGAGATDGPRGATAVSGVNPLPAAAAHAAAAHSVPGGDGASAASHLGSPSPSSLASGDGRTSRSVSF